MTYLYGLLTCLLDTLAVYEVLVVTVEGAGPSPQGIRTTGHPQALLARGRNGASMAAAPTTPVRTFHTSSLSSSGTFPPSHMRRITSISSWEASATRRASTLESRRITQWSSEVCVCTESRRITQWSVCVCTERPYLLFGFSATGSREGGGSWWFGSVAAGRPGSSPCSSSSISFRKSSLLWIAITFSARASSRSSLNCALFRVKP